MLILVILYVSLVQSDLEKFVCLFIDNFSVSISNISKSSLLQTLTGEIAQFDGKVRLYGSFCYVPQEPCQ